MSYLKSLVRRRFSIPPVAIVMTIIGIPLVSPASPGLPRIPLGMCIRVATGMGIRVVTDVSIRVATDMGLRW